MSNESFALDYAWRNMVQEEALDYIHAIAYTIGHDTKRAKFNIKVPNPCS